MTLAPTRVRKPPAEAKDGVTAYARAVEAGEIACGKWVRLAARRHLRDLVEGPARGLHFDIPTSEKALRFFDALRLPDGAGAGRPFHLLPWEQFVVGSLFGWLRADGKRRFRYALVETARANGKTPLEAGIALYLLVADGELGAQVYSAATTRDQAKIVFGDAVRMAEMSPGFRERLTKTVNNLAYLQAGAYFRPLSAEANTMDGLRVHGAMVDELHEHPSGEVMAKLRTGMKSSQPLLMAVTTAGYDRHSVCWDEHDLACKILEGLVVNDPYFAYIATLDDSDLWTDEAVWVKANPSLGTTVSLATLREECELARQIPGQQNSFKRLRLNLWTEQMVRWLDVAVWDGQPERRAEDALTKQLCYAGLDLASTTDLTALVLLFPDEDGSYDILPYFWMPEDRVRERAERDRVPYDRWVEAGYIFATQGEVVDYDAIRLFITGIGTDGHKQDGSYLVDRFDIQELAKDRWNSTQLGTQLVGDGVTVIDFGQGFASMTAPSKELERLLLDRKLRHGNNPVLRWMAANVAVQQDAAGNLKPAKDKSTGRIDGIVATVMALGRAIVHEHGSSVYDERGILVL